ncbi:hypothetical protein AALP_AA8G024900 [Arabis alpina]|uniref:Uncharacterized protein n=1 Tax=Arabis alpina TaxID=50452 RepID=A0A087G4I5_ARAAL|nr:hypothetical protein AALP_AA8G024900 [Arabis alpina]
MILQVNEGNAHNWDSPTTKYVEKCKFPKDGSPAKSLDMSEVWMFIAHYSMEESSRTYLTRKAPMGNCDLVPEKIHERSPIFLGSYDDVEEIKALYASEE